MAEAGSVPTRRALPLILIRGFGGIGVEDEKRVTYQGFNDGTVYPGKRGENYIYEGLILTVHEIELAVPGRHECGRILLEDGGGLDRQGSRTAQGLRQGLLHR